MAQDPLACKQPFWTQVTHNLTYNDFCIWNPNEGFYVRVSLKQVQCILEQEQNNVPAIEGPGNVCLYPFPNTSNAHQFKTFQQFWRRTTQDARRVERACDNLLPPAQG